MARSDLNGRSRSYQLTGIRRVPRIRVALAEHDGEITFKQSIRDKSDVGSYSTDLDMRTNDGRSLTVEAKKYASIINMFNGRKPDVLKIDVEGLEVSILRAMLRSPETMPAVIVVDMDSICCCMGEKCDQTAAAGMSIIKDVRAAGYESIGHDAKNIDDVVFYRIN